MPIPLQVQCKHLNFASPCLSPFVSSLYLARNFIVDNIRFRLLGAYIDINCLSTETLCQNCSTDAFDGDPKKDIKPHVSFLSWVWTEVIRQLFSFPWKHSNTSWTKYSTTLQILPIHYSTICANKLNDDRRVKWQINYTLRAFDE